MEFRAHIASLNMLAGYPKEGRARKVLFHYLRVNGVRIMRSMAPRLTETSMPSFSYLGFQCAFSSILPRPVSDSRIVHYISPAAHPEHNRASPALPVMGHRAG